METHALLPFLLSVAALLFVPGPTNTLLALAGAENGFRRSLPLLVAEASAYLLVVGSVSALLRAGSGEFVLLAPFLKLVSAAWVVRIAFAAWFRPSGASGRVVTIRRMFLTTLLNPKALVIATGIVPPASAGPLYVYLAVLCGCVTGAALAWLFMGSQFGRGRPTEATLLRKVTSIVLLGFAVYIGWTTIRALPA